MHRTVVPCRADREGRLLVNAAPPVLDLDDTASLEAADASGELRSAALGGAQVRATAAAVQEQMLDRLVDLRPRSVVFVANGGPAARAVATLISAVGSRAGLPLCAVAATPPWVGPLDVVVVAGNDAGDPSLVESADFAARRAAEVVVAAPDEGPMRAAGAGRAIRVPPRVPVFDHNTMLRFLAVGIAVLAAVDENPSRGRYLPDLEALAELLDAEAVHNRPANEMHHNPAKSLAARLHERRIVFAGDSGAATDLGRHASEVLLRGGVVASAVDLAEAIATAPRLSAGVAAPPGYDPFFHDEQLDGPRPQQGARVVVLSTGTERADIGRRIGVLGDADLVTADGEDTPVPGVGGELERLATLAVRLEMAVAYLQLLDAEVTQ